MTDWIDRYAKALNDRLGDEAGLELPKNRLLGLARDVAHGTERKNAPLATYLAGLYVGTSAKDAGEALDDALAAAEDLLEKG